MEGAITNLRGIHVFSDMQYEEEMSRFQLGLCSLKAIGFKWIPSSCTFVLPHFMSSPRKDEMESPDGGSSCICVVSVSVCNVN